VSVDGAVPLIVAVAPEALRLSQVGPDQENLYEPLPPEAVTGTLMPEPSSTDWFPGFETASTGEHCTASLAVAEWLDGEVTVSVSPISQFLEAGVTESETLTLPPAATDFVAAAELVPLERAQW
jgi:hypothetical protein